jgi:hypothetical protein
MALGRVSSALVRPGLRGVAARGLSGKMTSPSKNFYAEETESPTFKDPVRQVKRPELFRLVAQPSLILVPPVSGVHLPVSRPVS